MPIKTKICGLTTQAATDAAVQGGAAYVGFVFFEKSPRNISLESARPLAASIPPGVCKVALTVDAGDAALDAILEVVPIDMLQLHGSESVDRIAQLRARYGLPIMKAVALSDRADLPRLEEYSRIADQVLVDAKPPKDAPLPGGNGLAFDWKLLQGRRWPTPWMLAGGLTPDNVAEAVQITGARQVDVSSGVESRPGVKDINLIARFLKNVSQA